MGIEMSHRGANGDPHLREEMRVENSRKNKSGEESLESMMP